MQGISDHRSDCFRNRVGQNPERDTNATLLIISGRLRQGRISRLKTTALQIHFSLSFSLSLSLSRARAHARVFLSFIYISSSCALRTAARHTNVHERI